MRKNFLDKLSPLIFVLVTISACSTSRPTTPRIENDHTKFISRNYTSASDAPSAYKKEPEKAEEYDPSPWSKPKLSETTQQQSIKKPKYSLHLEVGNIKQKSSFTGVFTNGLSGISINET